MGRCAKCRKLAPDGDLVTCQRRLLCLFATPKALAVAALQRLWRGPPCHAAEVLPSGAAFLGTTRANVLILLGACKLLALLDLWVLNLMPRITCLCVACMMGAHPLLPP